MWHPPPGIAPDGATVYRRVVQQWDGLEPAHLGAFVEVSSALKGSGLGGRAIGVGQVLV